MGFFGVFLRGGGRHERLTPLRSNSRDETRPSGALRSWRGVSRVGVEPRGVKSDTATASGSGVANQIADIFKVFPVVLALARWLQRGL